jgi:hypothetical protein
MYVYLNNHVTQLQKEYCFDIKFHFFYLCLHSALCSSRDHMQVSASYRTLAKVTGRDSLTHQAH